MKKPKTIAPLTAASQEKAESYLADHRKTPQYLASDAVTKSILMGIENGSVVLSSKDQVTLNEILAETSAPVIEPAAIEEPVIIETDAPVTNTVQNTALDCADSSVIDTNPSNAFAKPQKAKKPRKIRNNLKGIELKNLIKYYTAKGWEDNVEKQISDYDDSIPFYNDLDCQSDNDYFKPDFLNDYSATELLERESLEKESKAIELVIQNTAAIKKRADYEIDTLCDEMLGSGLTTTIDLFANTTKPRAAIETTKPVDAIIEPVIIETAATVIIEPATSEEPLLTSYTEQEITKKKEKKKEKLKPVTPAIIYAIMTFLAAGIRLSWFIDKAIRLPKQGRYREFNAVAMALNVEFTRSFLLSTAPLFNYAHFIASIDYALANKVKHEPLSEYDALKLIDYLSHDHKKQTRSEYKKLRALQEKIDNCNAILNQIKRAEKALKRSNDILAKPQNAKKPVQNGLKLLANEQLLNAPHGVPITITTGMTTRAQNWQVKPKNNSLINGYSIDFNSYWGGWHVSHHELGKNLFTAKTKIDAINFVKNPPVKKSSNFEHMLEVMLDIQKELDSSASKKLTYDFMDIYENSHKAYLLPTEIIQALSESHFREMYSKLECYNTISRETLIFLAKRTGDKKLINKSLRNFYDWKSIFITDYTIDYTDPEWRRENDKFKKSNLNRYCSLSRKVYETLGFNK